MATAARRSAVVVAVALVLTGGEALGPFWLPVEQPEHGGTGVLTKQLDSRPDVTAAR
jgi:hypothetical protein